MVKVRIRGIDRVTRDMAYASEATYKGARRGTVLAAKHLMQKILEKFGKYQSTGGDPNGYGAWKRLKYETIRKKALKWGVGDKPLIASGKSSSPSEWEVIEGGVGRLAASVGTDNEMLLNHIYGAPRAHVPMRDPVRITAKEESEECQDIIEREILSELARCGL
jgi:hypothetical protein